MSTPHGNSRPSSDCTVAPVRPTTAERRHYQREARRLQRDLYREPLFRNAPPGVAQDVAAIKALATILMLGAAAFAVTWFVAALIMASAS